MLPQDLAESLSAKLKIAVEQIQADVAGLDPRIVRRELRKYLPRTHWSVIDQWAE
jgi:flagellar motor component MotA